MSINLNTYQISKTLLETIFPHFKKKLSIVFVYSDLYKQSGSTVMRGRQLSEIIKKQASNDYWISYQPLQVGYKNSLLFLTKGALKSASIELLARLKKNNILVFDPVDEAIPDHAIEFADAIIAASRVAYREYQKLYPRHVIFHIDHHADPRINKYFQPKNNDSLKTAYFGELVNTIIAPDIKNAVDFILIDTSRQNGKWLKKLPNYNMHYAIRLNRNIDRFKPFLKGFTAAHCNSNIIIQNTQEEAMLWLGNDYPFLLKSEPTTSNIIKHLEYVNSAYCSQEWKSGLEIMESIREQTSHQNIARQFFAMISKLS